jgi:hypothetical protein
VGFIVVGWLLSAAAITYVNIQKADAVEATTPATGTDDNDDIILPNPIYIELDKPTTQKAVVVNGTTIHATEVTFSGHGTVKGINFTDSGKGLIIPRGNTGIINVKGQVSIMTNTGDRASFNFQETGYPAASDDANGTIKASGGLLLAFVNLIINVNAVFFCQKFSIQITFSYSPIVCLYIRIYSFHLCISLSYRKLFCIPFPSSHIQSIIGH